MTCDVCGEATGVSIHAPVRGATLTGADELLDDQFQSTPPCGGRLDAPE